MKKLTRVVVATALLVIALTAAQPAGAADTAGTRSVKRFDAAVGVAPEILALTNLSLSTEGGVQK